MNAEGAVKTTGTTGMATIDVVNFDFISAESETINNPDGPPFVVSNRITLADPTTGEFTSAGFESDTPFDGENVHFDFMPTSTTFTVVPEPSSFLSFGLVGLGSMGGVPWP